MFVLGGIFIPFAEEIFFRGVLYTYLRQHWGFWASAIVSSLIFGAVHGQIAIAGAAAVLGFLLAWIYERSQSLFPAILIHGINNGVKILLLYALLVSGIDISGM
jgi:membrane protease YdiL (CAAX protease family)